MEYTSRWHSTSSPVDTKECHRRPKLGGQSTTTRSLLWRSTRRTLIYNRHNCIQYAATVSAIQLSLSHYLKAGIAPASVWDTATGENILNSLTWLPDDTMLAFVADPTGTGLTNLSVYSQNSGTIQTVQLPMQGSVSHPAGSRWHTNSL